MYKTFTDDTRKVKKNPYNFKTILRTMPVYSLLGKGRMSTPSRNKSIVVKLMTQAMCSTLCLTLISSTLASAVPYAPAYSRPVTYEISAGIPQDGKLDQYHNIRSSLDPVTNSLYLLRNTAIEDLLQSRRSLQILLGTEDPQTRTPLPS